MKRLVKLMGGDGDDGLLIPIAHIQAVEYREKNNKGGPYIMVGGRYIDVHRDVALAIADMVRAYWAHDAKDIGAMLYRQPGSPDGLGDRGA
jgi:hypothetical protein